MSLEKRIKGLVDLDYLKINSLYSGSSVNNLGIDINELEDKIINKDYIKERLDFEIEGLSLKKFIEY